MLWPLDCFAALAMTVELTQQLLGVSLEKTPRKNSCTSTDQANICHPRESGVECTRSKAKCRYQAELSLEPLVWTRGRNMPLDTR